MESCPQCDTEAKEIEVNVFASSLLPERCAKCGLEYGVQGIGAGSYSAALEFGIISMPILSSKDGSLLWLVVVALFAFSSVIFGAMRKPVVVSAASKLAAKISTCFVYFVLAFVIYKYQL